MDSEWGDAVVVVANYDYRIVENYRIKLKTAHDNHKKRIVILSETKCSRRMKKTILYLFLIIIICISCVKESDELVFDVAPAIELVEISQDTLYEFATPLTIKIKYEDGDGDLGTSDPDVNSIFVKDQRLEKADEYYLGPLAPQDAQISIQGTINLELANLFLLGNGTKENTIFSIYFVDRAGNQSNVIETEPITILKQ